MIIWISKRNKQKEKILDIFLEPDTLNLFWGDFRKLDALILNGEKCISKQIEKIKNSYEQKINS